jgi:PAS domain S-box-containing protein
LHSANIFIVRWRVICRVALLFDRDKRFIIVEGQALQALGYSTEEAEGKTLQEMVQSPESLATLTKIYDDTLNGESISLEVSSEAVTFELATVPVYDADGRIEYGLLVGRDISRRKQMADELLKREQTYRALVDHLPGVALMVFDHDLRYLIAGGDALEKAGYKPNEMLGKTLHDVLPPERVPDVIKHYQAALRGERTSYTREYSGRKYHVVALPILDADGNIQNGMIISYITDEEENLTL